MDESTRPPERGDRDCRPTDDPGREWGRIISQPSERVGGSKTPGQDPGTYRRDPQEPLRTPGHERHLHCQ